MPSHFYMGSRDQIQPPMLISQILYQLSYGHRAGHVISTTLNFGNEEKVVSSNQKILPQGMQEFLV